jgi:outer membrane protein
MEEQMRSACLYGLLASSMTLGCLTPAHAEEHRFSVSLGAAHITPRSSSGPFTITEIGGSPVNLPQEGTGLSVRSADTLVITIEGKISSRLSAQFAVGWPPTHKLAGTGSLAGAGVLGEGQQLSPTLFLIYNFFPDQPVRPFVALGVNYTTFRKTRITNDAYRTSVYGPDSTISTSASSSTNPAAKVGFNVDLSDRVFFTAALAYLPLKTTLEANADHTALGQSIKARSELKLRSVITAATVGYRF